MTIAGLYPSYGGLKLPLNEQPCEGFSELPDCTTGPEGEGKAALRRKLSLHLAGTEEWSTAPSLGLVCSGSCVSCWMCVSQDPVCHTLPQVGTHGQCCILAGHSSSHRLL